MLTNTFTPHIGGVARSVDNVSNGVRRKGHKVLVAAPDYKNKPITEPDVLRFPALTRFNGSDFSFPFPSPLSNPLVPALVDFHPQVVHSHHPFLLGHTAFRVATACNLPLVFTYHTMYELYTHYMPGDSQRLKRFVIDFVSRYCNLCDAIIAPTKAIAEILRERGISSAIRVIPSGVDETFFSDNSKRENNAPNNDLGNDFRSRFEIPADAFVVGHVGRLAKEKNLDFLTHSVSRFLEKNKSAWFIVGGDGPLKKHMSDILRSRNVLHRCRFPGYLEKAELVAAYRAMDVFTFASHTETQGMVLAEAMASGVPVVAVDATGTREIIEDGINGRLLRRDDTAGFAAALNWVASLDQNRTTELRNATRSSASAFGMDTVSELTLQLYSDLIASSSKANKKVEPVYATAFKRLWIEGCLFCHWIQAAFDSLRPQAVWEIGQSIVADGTRDAYLDSAPANHPPKLPIITMPERTSLQVLKARLLGQFWSKILKLQCTSWNKQIDELDELDAVLKSGKRVLLSFWHGKYVPLFALLGGRSACVFTSDSARGDVIAEICHEFGYECVRTPDNGYGNAMELMRRGLAGQTGGGIAVDGPLGPYHRVKRGVIKLASEEGFIIVPASVSARRKRVLKHRWDKLELPALFTKVGLTIGKPLEIPSNLTPSEASQWTQRLKEELDSLDRRADKMVGLDTL